MKDQKFVLGLYLVLNGQHRELAHWGCHPTPQKKYKLSHLVCGRYWVLIILKSENFRRLSRWVSFFPQAFCLADSCYPPVCSQIVSPVMQWEPHPQILSQPKCLRYTTMAVRASIRKVGETQFDSWQMLMWNSEKLN